MARAYGQSPHVILGVAADSVLAVIIDAAAHALGSRALAGAKGFPTLDLGTIY